MPRPEGTTGPTGGSRRRAATIGWTLALALAATAGADRAWAQAGAGSAAAAVLYAPAAEPTPAVHDGQGPVAADGPAAAPALVLRPTDWLLERDAAGTLVLHPVLPGTRLRDLSRAGWRIESDLVSGALFALPTRPGSDQRDDRRDPVALAANAAEQLALVAPPAAGGAIVLGRTLGHPLGYPLGEPLGRPAVHAVIRDLGQPVPHPAAGVHGQRPPTPVTSAAGRPPARPAADLPGLVIPPTGLRPVIAPTIPGFPLR